LDELSTDEKLEYVETFATDLDSYLGGGKQTFATYVPMLQKDILNDYGIDLDEYKHKKEFDKKQAEREKKLKRLWNSE
jgi:hypothetical protein